MSRPKSKKKDETKLVDIQEGDLSFGQAKVKVSMWMDGDVVEAVRLAQKQKTGTERGYQTLLNQKLREIFLQADPEISEIKRRLTLLEKAVARGK